MDGTRLLTLLEVADLLRLSPHTIRAMARNDRLQPVRICRRLLFDPRDVEALLRKAQGDRQIAADESQNDRSQKTVR